jgi:uncharacterized protein DUF3617
MNSRSLVAAVAMLSLAGATEGQVLKQRKPGLWEIQYAAESSDPKEKQAQMEMAERLKNMPPEKRAQMEAYMQKSGTGMTLGPGGVPTMVMRVCLTAQDIVEESGGFMKSMREHRDCTSKIVAQSASEVRIHAVCQSQQATPSEIDARIFDIAADHYSVDVQGHGARGEMHMQQKARWLGADCKGM